ncbi:SH3 domain-containing protein [Acidovorax sp. sif1233]|uniref:SH3 domain-containing protein n=1 Tax=Acidovorax sp. sif1233 TaxID=2854792 RepID=UPI001C4845B3|nr:SH3 domain-containing protein [Acidovorax sp. sif1233]MBV7455622.1 SH3 domain-containing protein [Acidovorax sp. sif1233]
MNWLHRGALAAWLALAALAPLGAQAQESAVVKRATQLRDTPADTGASVAPLEANTVVTRSNERKGPWTRVSTPQGATGWVHMFDLGPQSGSAAPSSNAATSGLRGLGGLFGGNSGPTTTATSTVGIRGLGAEDIANAQPNPAAVGQAEGLRVNADQARQFATTASLQPRAVPPLAAPQRPSSSGSPGATGSSANPSDPNFSPN